MRDEKIGLGWLKLKALSSNPNTAKNKQKTQKNQAYNPRYSRKQRFGARPQQIVLETLSRKNPSLKKGWWSGSRCRPSVQAPVPQQQSIKN
jgi:hypothetical protein